MLRISVLNNSDGVTFQLEGRLAGPWVAELGRCWRETFAGRREAALRFDLTGVTFIDATGKAFLAARHAEGAEFVAACCLMRAVVAEITGLQGHRRDNQSTCADREIARRRTSS